MIIKNNSISTIIFIVLQFALNNRRRKRVFLKHPFLQIENIWPLICRDRKMLRLRSYHEIELYFAAFARKNAYYDLTNFFGSDIVFWIGSIVFCNLSPLFLTSKWLQIIHFYIFLIKNDYNI